MGFKRINPIMTEKQYHLTLKPSLYRACVMWRKKEYDECEMKIMQLYRTANAPKQN